MWLVFKYLLFDWMENIMNINTEPEPAFWNSKTLSSPSQLDKKIITQSIGLRDISNFSNILKYCMIGMYFTEQLYFIV